jgi:amino acid adenylation domain-containing protein
MSETLQEKKARLRSLLEKPQGTVSVPRVEPRPHRLELEPLSSAQQALWFVSKLEGPNPAYNIPAIVRMSGDLDVGALSRALSVLVRRHEALRTRFVERDGVPGQVLSDIEEVRLEPRQVTPAEAEAVYSRAAQHPFDMLEERLFRAELFTEASDRFVLVVAMHHGISDAWSLGVFLREMVSLYEAFSRGEDRSLEPLAVTYADYVHWEKAWLESGVLERQLGFWKRQLEGLPPLLALPTDRPRPALQSSRGATVHFAVPQHLLEQLKLLSNEQKCSMFVTLLTALGVLLHRHSSQRDLAIGTGVANRRRPELEGLIGFFVNTLVIRTRMEEQSFTSLLKATRDAALQALAHQDAPYQRIVEELRPERSLGHTPFFQVMLTLQNVPFKWRTELPAVTLETEIADSGSAKFDLSFAIQEEADGLRGQIEYRSDIFDDPTVRRLAGQFLLVLRQVVEDPERSLGEMELLGAAERHQLLVEWNATGTDYPREATLAALFARQAAQTPELTALEYGSEELSYGDLDRRSNQVARFLIRHGARPGDLVGFFMERSAAQVVAILGILKSGAAYLPLDPAYPAVRLALMIQDSGSSLLLTQESLVAALPETAAQVVCLDAARDEIARESEDGIELGGTGDDLAYVIYTSGSTGRPKGVAVPQRGVIRLVRNTDYVHLGIADRLAQVANLSFDAATFEIWGALLNGGTLVGVPQDVALSPRDLAAFLREREISSLFLTSALFNQVAQLAPDAFGSVRDLLVGGEAVDPGAMRRVLRAGPPARLLNGYGPTENTTFSVCFVITEVAEGAATVPIGRPIANTRAYVLDERLQLVPLGVEGELFLGGDGLAREYLNAPELTRERFVESPSVPGERLYKTGDLVRFLPDGNIEYRGRRDHQVKIRGFRIELGEIEAQLQVHPSVREAVVLAREEAGGKRLVGYVVPSEGVERPSLAGELKDALQRTLPEYMVPSAFVLLDALPLTVNGKVDRGALPAPEEEDFRRGEYVAPSTELEHRLCEIWAEILKVERVGITDSFFDLGGHSLLATRVVSQVRSVLGRELPLRAMFENPTIAGLCERLPELGGGLTLPEIEVLTEREGLPLSYAQQRLWFIDRLEGESSHYNIAGALRVRGAFDSTAFARAVRTIVERHESLRTVFREIKGEARQVILADFDCRLAERDLSGLEADERERTVRLLALEDERKPFDLSRDLLLRAGLLKLSEEEHVVLLNMHHIASDGWSVGVLLKELETLYQAYRSGEENPLPPLRVQYADYAHWQRQWLRGEVLESQLSYWRRQLEGLPLVHGLLLDSPRPARQGFEGGEHVQRLSGGLKEGIEAFCRERGVTLFMFLQAAFSVLLGRYSRETDIVVGSPIAGRVHRDVEPLIGFFINTLVLRNDLSGNPRFAELMASSRQTVLDAYAHQHVPFEMLVEELKPERSLSHNPLFQLLIVLQNAEQGELALGGSRIEPLDRGQVIVKFDLELSVLELADGLVVNWVYKRELFHGETIERMAGHFQVLLAALAEGAGSSLAELPLLSAAERHQVLVTANAARNVPPPEAGLVELFLARAAAAPESPAVFLAGAGGGPAEVLSYGELERLSALWARSLRGLGVGPEVRVGICIRRSPRMIVAVLAILRAGGAYVPLDPAWPEERLAWMAGDAGVDLVLTERESVEPLLAGTGRLLLPLFLDGEPAEGPDLPSELPLATQAVYVIYTSGSTGRPKGVVAVHGGLAAFTEALAGIMAVTPQDRMLLTAPLAFDAAGVVIWPALTHGAAVVVHPDPATLSTEGLLALCAGLGLTVLDMPGALWRQMLSEMEGAGLRFGPEVRLVMTGGESLSPEFLRQWGRSLAPETRLISSYGPTETTVVATIFQTAGREAVGSALTGSPLGGLLPGTGIYLLDGLLAPVPLNVPGEIFIGGAGMTRGYLERPRLTAAAFVPDPWGPPGARLYRTGDAARRRPSGDLEFLGRVDQQVKIRGFRIEPGEIEAQLVTHESVSEAVVVAREDRPGDKRLVAYVVGREGAAPDPGTLREHVMSKLPDYMVPSVFVMLPVMPQTRSGKVDRRALPAPEVEDYQRARHVAPRSELERQLCEIWEEVLGVERVGIEDSFFELGGHSLLATRVVSRVRSALGRELPLRAMFEYPTIRELCEGLPELGGGWVLPPIEVVAERTRLPLSYAQQRLWFIDRLESGSSQYNIPGAMRARGALDPAAFAAAVRTVVERHESLRTVFREIDGEVVQDVQDGVVFRVAERDLSGWGEAEREREVRRLALEDARKPFDLSRDLPFRAGLLKLSEEDSVVLFNMHHIASDGWSVGVLAKELETLYEAYLTGKENPLAPLRVQYADYAQWQRQWLRGEVLESQLSYWKRQLDGLPQVHNLPLDKPRPARPGFEGGEHVQRLEGELRDRIETFCREHGVTLFMFLDAAFAVLLSRYSQETDIVVGSPIAGRTHGDVEPLIGFFINTLVLRSDLSGNPGFAELLGSTRQTILDAYAHQHVPFEMLVEELKPERSLSHNPLFQILLVLQNMGQGEMRLGGSRLEPLDGNGGIVKFDLETTLVELQDGLAVYWWYKQELFHGETIERMARHFQVLLAALVDDPSRPVADLPLLSAADREQMLVEWNDTGAPAGGELRLHELFAARAAETPEPVALIDGERELSYGELAAEAHRLAHHLRSLGVGPERIVGVFLERRAELVVALLAVLEAGGAYLPLDPAHPRARLERVLEDSGAALVITQESLADQLPWRGPAVVLERDWAAIARRPLRRPLSDLSAENLAYVLFTSGSTGTPKGVAVTHRSAVELVLWAGRAFSPEELSGVLAATSLSFDLSVFELFVPLSWGGTVILAANALALPGLPAAHRVRLVNTVPSALAELVHTGGLPAGVRTVNLAGEPLSRALADRIWATGTVEALWNLYGPSEDTTYSTFAPVERASSSAPRIGRPIAATRAYVVERPDQTAQPVPVGVAGELWLGGAGLARGYLGRPDLTAERFIPDPFSGLPGARLYRTGDLVRWLPAGELDYLGRIDHQVKVRGFRIELGEIEAQLRSRASVRGAVVLARGDGAGGTRLVAYVVPSESAEEELAGELTNALRETLPEYMVPSVFVVLEALPLTANGKVDRRALPAPEEADFQRGRYVEPRTELERRLCEIWREILGVERVGIEDSFFALGGHSLLATRVVSRVRSALGRELPLRAIFEHPTVRGLSERLPELGEGLVLSGIDVLANRERLPLSYAQQRLWFIDRLEGGSSQYNMPAALRVRGALDRAALGAAFRTIVERHESLRTVFGEMAGEVVQIIRDDAGFRLVERDLSGLGPEERESEVRRLALEDARRPFDLSSELPLRVGLLKLSEEEHVVLSNMHHIASDGWSIGVLMRELRTLYEAYRAGEENPLPPLRVQYADYAHWQRQWLRGEVLADQLSYWRRQLADLPLVHGLPLDKPRPAQQGFEGGEHGQRLERDLKDRIDVLCRERGVTLFMFLQAAFSVLLGRFSQEKDVVVGSPIAGRVHADVEPLIGFFVNTLVLRSDLSGNPRFVELLESSRKTILDGYAHQHVPFEMLVEELRPERSLRHSPLFQILIVLQNTGATEMRLGDARFEPVDEGGGIVKLDLELNVEELENGLHLHWSYKKELFHGETIERLASSFEVLLEGILETPEERIQSLPLLTEAERLRLLSVWNGRETPYPRERCIHELFEAQVERSPDAVAVVLDGSRLTYAELSARANRLAHFLIEQGVGADTLVGLCVERSLEMLVGILGILKAGGAYVPLDPEYPEARLVYMLEDSAVPVVLTQSRLSGLGCFAGQRTVSLDDPDFEALLEAYPGGNPDRRGLRSSHLAYMIYTSGSTGQPKGVLVEHRSVVRLVIGADFLPLNADTVMLQASSVSFDAATLEIWGALLNGGRLVLYPERVPEVGALNAQLERHGVNTLWLTAGLLDQWSGQLPRASRLKWVLTGGDVVNPSSVARVYEGLPDVQLINGYGPTENTTFTACYAIPRALDPRQALPLGRPINGTGVYVLEEGLELAAPGGVGELYALGDGVARGYLNRPALTAERFIVNPYTEDDGARLYRTGDLARWRVDGLLEFLGRKDEQVKVRGFRVELGEIEAQLRSQASVRDALVLARADGAGGKRLVGYVVPSDGMAGRSLIDELKSALRKTLPDYMVPSVFVALEALPLTANGKIDRKALPAPEEGDLQRGEYVAPRTELARRLCEIWAEVLGVERVGITDSFFDLGGHSLLATRVVSQVRSALGRELPLRALFENPTIAGLCERLPELGGDVELPAIEVLVEREGLPLSYAQQRLWFIDRLEDGSSHYNIPGAARVRGDLDKAAFARAVRTIVERHESLRTIFQEADGEVVQVIRQDVDFLLAERDLSGLAPEERESEVGRLALEDARRPFDLGSDPLLRVALLQLSDDEHVVLFNMHHIASDGWSMGVLMRELGALYEAYRAGRDNPLPPLRVQYADYAHWQRQWLRGEILEDQLSYWRRQLAGLPLVHGLPLDKPRPARQGFDGGEHVQRLDGDLKGRIEAVRRERGVTLFMFLQAAFSVLLGRYSQETDIVVGSPIAGRVHHDVEPLIGFFVNTLVLRADLSGAPRLVDLLESSRRTILDAYAHQHVPFEMLVEELKPERSLSHSPLFQILFALQNTEQVDARLGAARLEPFGGNSGVAKFDLELNVLELEDGLALYWAYKQELFHHETIERMAGHFAVLLAALAEHASTPVADLPLLSGSERTQMLVEWNETGAPVGGELCLHELLAARAEEIPQAVALIDGERELSYGELAGEAHRLAHHLRSLGVGPERIVGVCLERTAEMVVTLLAVLEAGGAYLPLDPAHPRARLERVLADSGAAAVVTQESLADRLPWNGPVVILERDRAAIARHPDHRPTTGVSRENLAYVLFTSGSTGTPKGVAITHRSAVEMVRWAAGVFSPEDLSGVLAATSLSFDLSVFELFVPLSAGGTVILAANALALPGLPAARRVRLVNTVPSALAELVHMGGLPAGVRTVNLAGEPLPRALADRIWATGTVEALWNLYGPSEDTTYSTYAWVDRESSSAPRIGRPISATWAYVVDRRDQPVPVGVAGELWLGGAGLARGYLGRPDLTAERFIPDPFSGGPGARLYRTGDLVRWLPDGELDYLGRIDHQVKVRGFRIELGEIEASLAAHPEVREAVVLTREDQPGDRRLVAYVVGDVEAAGLREHLSGCLPEYMIPSFFVALDALPRTPNGKVDRKALPAPLERGDDTPLEPRTPIEEMVAAIWAEVLGVERVGLRESFFELGGHSLLATRVLSRLRRVFGVEIPLRELFEVPTVERLAQRVEAALRGDAGLVAPPIVPVPRERRLPLSFAQQRLWFLEQLEPGRPTYNIPLAQRAEGELRVEILAAALAEVGRRHEALRTVFASMDGEPFQVICPADPFPLSVVDLSALPVPVREAAARTLAAEEAARPFDLALGPLLRTRLLRLESADHAILLTMHHIVSDGWSMGVLVREAAELYRALGAGEMPRLPELPVQYADFAVWERGRQQGEVLERQIAYWRGQLAGLPPLLELPTDRPRPPVQSFRGGNRGVRLAPELAASLRDQARSEGATLFMGLLAGFQALLGRLSGQEDLAVGTPTAGRGHLETEGLIGFFVNTLVLRGDLSGSPAFRGLLERTRETMLAAHMHQEIPFERLVEELAPERSLAHSPLFQVMLALQNLPDEASSLGALRMRPLEGDGGATAKFDLTLAFWEDAGELVGNLEYSTDLFDAGTIDRLGERFERLLSAAVAGPEVPVVDLPLLSGAERTQVLVEWNGTGAPVGGELCLHELFAARAEEIPLAVALIDGERELSYGELAGEAHRLAHHLRSLGVGPERIVGVCLERTAETVVTLLAVLEAGGAYLPLDPAHPRARLERVLADSGAAVVVTQESLADRLPWNGPVVVLERDRAAIARHPDHRPTTSVSRENLAYVLFTSGSTGTPKGVAITHRSGVEMVRWAAGVFSPEDLSGVLAATSLSFDLSVFELFVPLSAGGTVILAANALALPGLPAAHRVRLINTVPSALAELVHTGGLPAGVRTVNLAGEPLPRALADRIWATGTVEALWNLYGPSEDTTYSTYAWVERESSSAPRIGRPISATRAYVVDRRDQPVPVGVAGELWLGGAGLARGYLGRPDLTAERFIPDPFSGGPGVRLYRTGDLVRWLPDGELDYLGRIDHQVKVRGFRIELGEIEATLAAHPEVREAVVLAREDQPGNRRLVAYLVGGVEAAGLREHLSGRLPEYMIPSFFVALDALPRTPNGKVDRKALPAPGGDRAAQETAYVAPRDTFELELVRLWEETLGVQPIGVQDSFFTLGGHSLLAVRLVARMSRRLGRALPLLELFQNPTIESLARRLRTDSAEGTGSSPIVALQATGRRRPFFCVHPGGGTVLTYVALSRHLGTDRPFYGLQAQELEEGTVPDSQTVETMAAGYVAAVREVQPAGPYLLGGWSLGGVVAYEMARQLREAGEEIELLALIDAHAPQPRKSLAEDGDIPLLSTFARNLGLPVDQLPLTLEDVRGMSADQRMALLVAEGRRFHILPPDVGIERLSHLFRAFAAHVQAMERYRPGSFDGRLTLYRAAGEDGNGSGQGNGNGQDALGWSQLALRGVDIREIQGTHFTVMREPAVAELAARLAEDLP